ncbi:hypothetical protein UlMin_005321 [Ulmus minor]
MEDSIASFCQSMASFCNHLESRCDALNQSVRRLPIPLGSASSTFLQCLNRRVSSASNELNLLESMSLGTVSFEELLGHCNEIYKENENHLLQLQDRLKPLGYIPEFEIEDEDVLPNDSSVAIDVDSRIVSSSQIAGSFQNSLDDDASFDESFSLKSLGISSVCLASLASEANSKVDDLDIPLYEPKKQHDLKEPDYSGSAASKGRINLDLEEADNVLKPSITLVKDDYEGLPSYMRGLASWEDLLTAVDKLNLSLNQRTKGCNFFRQDEISSLGLGARAKSYLLLLVRMNRLVVETKDGLISYRVL